MCFGLDYQRKAAINRRRSQRLCRQHFPACFEPTCDRDRVWHWHWNRTSYATSGAHKHAANIKNQPAATSKKNNTRSSHQKKSKAVKINKSAVAVAFAVATWPAGTAISSANKAATWEVATAVPRLVNKPATLVDTIATTVLEMPQAATIHYI